MIIDVPKRHSIPPQVAFVSSSPVSSPDSSSVSSPVSSPVTSYEALPGFKYVTSSQKQKLLVRKLNLCRVVFDFTDADPKKNQIEKDIKQKTLLELVDYVTTSANGGPFSETVMQEIIKTVSENLFRSLPSPVLVTQEISKGYDNIDDDFEQVEKPLFDPAWPHLKIVYELLLRFVISSETDAKFASKRYIIDHSFICRLLDLFESQDPREREYLKLIIHHIYAKFKVHRAFTRKAINNIFYWFIYENEKHHGIADLLEIVGSIIDGFVLPLKKQHELFLMGRVLMPLHKPKCLFMYQRQLSYCIKRLVQKDCNLADTVIKGLLKYWPIANSSKEVMFLRELQKVLEITSPQVFQQCMVPLFRQLARCLSSSHFLVAQRTLFLWNSNHIENLIKENYRVILPIIFPALEEKARNNWKQDIKDLTLNVRKVFFDLDRELFEECLNKCQEDEAKEEEIKATRETTWKRLEELAAAKATSNECLVKLQEDEAKDKEIEAKDEPTRKHLDEIDASKDANEDVLCRPIVEPQTVESIDFRYPIPHGVLYFTQYNKPCWPVSSQLYFQRTHLPAKPNTQMYW